MEENERQNEFAARRAARQKKKKRTKMTIALCVILAAIVGLFNIFFGYDRVHQDKTVTIDEGSSIFDIADTLKKEGVISKKAKFAAEVLLSGNRGKLKFGTFELEKGMKYSDVVELMVNEGAKKESVTLTVPEGFSVENIIDRMTELGIGSEDEIKAALSADYAYDFIDKIPQKDGQKYKLQGFLFPATYEFYKDADAKTVIDTMLAEFDKRYKKLAANYDNVYDIITKASMVEREARIDSERARIAGVFENRLADGMKLQIDATVAYVVSDGKYDVQRIMYSDLKKDSPYNTYIVTGLPVGPICNPGEESIKAALSPEKNTYLFYHTDENKKDGSHIFTETYEEHQSTLNN